MGCLNATGIIMLYCKMMRARTMVYLDADQHRALRLVATREGMSMAELLRRLVRRYLEEGKGAPKPSRATYMKLVNLGASGKTDVSQRHDAYVARAIRRGRSR